MEKKGMINRYTCENCRKSIVTVILEDGTTPAFLECEFGCDVNFKMVSSFYRIPQEMHPLEPNQYEWYKPKKLKGLDPHTRQHVRMGGLLLRKRFGIADMFRGNCECGKWLIIPPTIVKNDPLKCECGRKYYAERNGNELKYQRIEE